MKALKNLSFVVLLVVFALTSCTIEKRLYSSGYHIDFKKEKSDSEKQEAKTVFIERKELSSEVSIVEDTLVVADIVSVFVNEQEEVLLLQNQENTTNYSYKKAEPAERFVKPQSKKQKGKDSIFESHPWGVAAIIILIGLILLWLAAWIFLNVLAPGIGGV